MVVTTPVDSGPMSPRGGDGLTYDVPIPILQESRVTKLVLYALTSLDGAVDDPHRYFPESSNTPSAPVVDDELAALENAMLESQTAVLLGRGMHDQWSRYWPTSDEQPFADFINTVRKYVLTSRPLETDWPNVEAVSGPLADVVADLKSRTDGDIGVHGSSTLAQSLLAEGLVDELCLSVGRVIDPVGRRLYEKLPDRVVMQLIEAVPTSSGSVWMRYRLPRS